MGEDDVKQPETPQAEGEAAASPEGEAGAETKEFESLYFKIQNMGVSERIALALKGGKEARALLIKETNKLIQLAVINSPRITDPEIATIAKSRSVHDEVLRRIGTNKEWLKNYEVRSSLVLNPRTPLPLAMKLIGTLALRDIQHLAKSKNVASTVAAMARKILSAKKA